MTRLQQQAGSKAEANALQVKVELQADCLSGVWVNREEKKRPGFLEAGDIDAALTTASAIGDDTLQRQATGRVVPDSFTHGSAAQRKQWFMTGYQQGTVQACNTFGSVSGSYTAARIAAQRESARAAPSPEVARIVRSSGGVRSQPPTRGGTVTTTAPRPGHGVR